MNRLTVLYGHPKDPGEFDRYYREVHIPIAKRMKGLEGWTIGKCESATLGEQFCFKRGTAARRAGNDKPEQYI